MGSDSTSTGTSCGAELEKELAGLGGSAALREACFDSVVRWEWFKGTVARDPIPHQSEALGSGAPKKLSKEPKNKATASRVGVDALGRTRVRETYFIYRDSPYPHHELFHYGTARIIVARLATVIAGEPQRLEDVTVLKLEDGRVIELDGSTYHYGANGLLERAEHPYGTAKYSYDELGVLLEVDYAGETRYRRKPKGVTMASAMRRIEELLMEHVPVALEAAPDEPVFCFALVHSLTEHPLPPLIGLGLERERARLLAESDPKRAYWDPIEWELFEDDRFALQAPELLMACEVANHMCVDQDSIEPVRKMLWKVRDRLADRVPKQLTTTKDFVALVLHGEHDGLEKDLKLLKRKLDAPTKRALEEVLP